MISKLFVFVLRGYVLLVVVFLLVGLTVWLSGKDPQFYRFVDWCAKCWKMPFLVFAPGGVKRLRAELRKLKM